MTHGSDIHATHPRPHSIPPPPPPQTPRSRHARQEILRVTPRPPVDPDPQPNAVAAELVRSISRVLTTVDEERRVLVEAQERRREAEVENAALRSELNLERVLRLRTEAELRRLRHNFVPPLPRAVDFEKARAAALRDAKEADLMSPIESQPPDESKPPSALSSPPALDTEPTPDRAPVYWKLRRRRPRWRFWRGR
jgi:hypothetical protein